MNADSVHYFNNVSWPSKTMKRVVYGFLLLITIFAVMGTRKVTLCAVNSECDGIMASTSFHNPAYIKATVGMQKYYLSEASTPDARTRGLSGTKSLQADEGMLFKFDEPGRYGFWMKDMNYPLDIVWLNAQKQVVHIENNVSPQSYPQSYFPSKAAQYVIELNANETIKSQLKIGDTVQF